MRKLTLAMVLLPVLGQPAQAVLRIGVSESDSPPIVLFDKQGQLQASLSRDLGDALAAAMGTQPLYVVTSRKRVEPNLDEGKVDLVCNANPAWTVGAERFGWSDEFYPQVERVMTLKTHPRQVTRAEDLAGLRVGVILGYSYAVMEPLWQQGMGARVNYPRLDVLLKGLDRGGVDAVISSELELAYWAKQNPAIASRMTLQPWQVSYLPTRCAVSPKGAYSVKAVNQGIETLGRKGELRRILMRYEWKAR